MRAFIRSLPWRLLRGGIAALVAVAVGTTITGSPLGGDPLVAAVTWACCAAAVVAALVGDGEARPARGGGRE